MQEHLQNIPFVYIVASAHTQKVYKMIHKMIRSTISPPTQQKLLRHALQQTGASRSEFADMLKVSKRSLDAWMLPDSSKGFRTMSPQYKNEVERLLIEAQVTIGNRVTEATLSKNVPVIRCDKYDFSFPTIYRQTILVEGIDIETGLRDPSGDYQVTSYSLAEDASFRSSTNAQKVLKAEPISSRNTPADTGWLRISEHRTLDRADAHIRSVVEAMLAPTFNICSRLYKFEGRIFSLIHHDKPREPEAKDNLTLYLSDAYLEVAQFFIAGREGREDIRDNEWRLVLDADGKEIETAYDWED